MTQKLSPQRFRTGFSNWLTLKLSETRSIECRNWASYARNLSSAWGLFWAVLGLAITLGLHSEDVAWPIVALSALCAAFLLCTTFSTWFRKLELSEEGLRVRTLFSDETIAYPRIKGLLVERWDGGWVYEFSGPRHIKVVSLRVSKRQGKLLRLTWAYMPREQARMFAIELGKRCDRDFESRVEVAPKRRWFRIAEKLWP